MIGSKQNLGIQCESVKSSSSRRPSQRIKLLARGIAIIGMLLALPADAQTGLPIINMIDDGSGGTKYSLTLQLLALMTLLTLLPSLLLMMTSFVRIIIVMSLLRQALGTAQTPPNQVLVGISLFLTIFIMSPVLTTVYDEAITPYLEEQVSFDTALVKAEAPFRNFMLNQTRETDIAMFVEIANNKNITTPADVPLSTLVPAFITSELKSAFSIGFLIYIPFIVIDLVVASVLMSMGMMMLSPMMISMPFKLMLFVLVDGWTLIMGSLTASFVIS
ncbi:MAG: flagellar biosynthetic protein FliP [Reinekea sp.]|jgi:flagellar biosynthetic protein FliP|uniref:flagellar type III secretion system pore protein FliP n=1 Tax=Reinekea sp. TaxID=1970455 RepID=UPI0039898C0E|tara:strand:- start:3857 stop:4681 length:825 start_codon:yes stop_codon:yes gene_type:complete